MTIPNPKPRNDIGRWIVLALLCFGGSTGGTYLRPHNPNITTTEWNKMTRDVDNLQRDLAELKFTVREVLRLVPQQPLPQQP